MSIVRNIFHLSFQTDEYADFVKFYCETMEFDYMYGYKIGDFKTMLHMEGQGPKNEDMDWLCYIRVAPEVYLEVFNGVVNPPDFAYNKINKEASKVLHSITLGCEDPEKVTAYLKEKGVPFENGYAVDPEGTKIRIVKRKYEKETAKERIFNSLVGASIYVNDLAYMTDYITAMGGNVTAKTESAVKIEIGDFGQYLELIQSPTKVVDVADGVLGHIALQVYSISDAVYEWGLKGVRCCMHAMMKDNPFPVEKGVKGNIAVDHNEIVWNVTEEGNRFEIMYQPGDTEQQKFERNNPF